MARPRGFDEKIWKGLPQIVHDRVYLPDRTLGSWMDERAGILCKILELPWKDNRRGISCIPEGEYLVTYSDPVLPDDPNTEEDESGGRHPRPYAHYIIHNVPNRSGILVHRGARPTHSLGCQLVSGRFVKVDTSEPELDPADSGKKLQWLTENLPRQFRLLIEAKSGNPYR